MYKPRKNIDLVVPFNNENQNLQTLIPKILKTIKRIKKFNFRLIFIDDGSTDGGSLIVKKFKKNNNKIILLKNSNKFGQTYCYKSYLRKFKNADFIRMDADNQDDPIYLIKLSKFITKGYDIILTDRKLRKHSIYMIILTFMYNKLIYFLTGIKLKSFSSSLAYFNKKYIPKKKLNYNDHRYLPIISIFNGAKKIKIFPVIHKARLHGSTKYGMFRKILFALPEFLFFFYRLKKGNFNQ